MNIRHSSDDTDDIPITSDERVLQDIIREIWDEPEDITNATETLETQRNPTQRNAPVPSSSVSQNERNNNSTLAVSGVATNRGNYAEMRERAISGRTFLHPTRIIGGSSTPGRSNRGTSTLGRNNLGTSRLGRNNSGSSSFVRDFTVNDFFNDGDDDENETIRSRRGNTNVPTVRGRNSTSRRSHEDEDTVVSTGTNKRDRSNLRNVSFIPNFYLNSVLTLCCFSSSSVRFELVLRLTKFYKGSRSYSLILQI